MKAAGKRWVSWVAGLALGGATALAAAEPVVTPSVVTPMVTFSSKDFNVNPGALGGEEANFAPFFAGGINFSVTSEVDQYGGSGNTARFDETGSAQFGSFLDRIGGNNLSSLDTGLGLSRSRPIGYQLYALFSGEGTTRTVSSSNGPLIQGTFTSFEVNFFVDRDNNTTFANTGTDNFGFSRTRTGTITDDVLVLTGNLIVGSFNATPLNPPSLGDFHVIFNITGFGTAPFFSTAVDGSPLTIGDINGVNSFLSSNITFPPGSFTDGSIVGSGNTSFGGQLTPTAVPEPGSLALVGLAFVGAGLARRKVRTSTMA